MAKPSRIRRIFFFLLAVPSALALIAAIIFGFMYLTFVDRWGKPTDFAAQHAALTRSHLGLGPNESANTAAWRQIQDDVFDVHSARVPDFVSLQGVTHWPGELFYEDATADDAALRSQLLVDLEQRRVFERLDELALNPRVVLEPAANATLMDMHGDSGARSQLVRALSWRVHQAIKRGDLDAALNDLSRIDTISRVVGCTPSLISGFSSSAIAAKSFDGVIAVAVHPTLTPEQGARLAERVQSTSLVDLEYALRGERIIALDTINAHMKPSVIVPADSRSQMAKVDEIFDALDARRKLTVEQRRANSGGLADTDRLTRLERDTRYLAASLMLPSLSHAITATEQIHLEKVGTILTVAIVRYRLDHAGKLPATLDALVPDYLAELPIDPFSGKPPIYVKGPVAVPQSGVAIRESKPQVTAPFMLYSVGFDATDNAGKLGDHRHEALRRKGEGLDFILYPRED